MNQVTQITADKDRHLINGRSWLETFINDALALHSEAANDASSEGARLIAKRAADAFMGLKATLVDVSEVDAKALGIMLSIIPLIPNVVEAAQVTLASIEEAKEGYGAPELLFEMLDGFVEYYTLETLPSKTAPSEFLRAVLLFLVAKMTEVRMSDGGPDDDNGEFSEELHEAVQAAWIKAVSIHDASSINIQTRAAITMIYRDGVNLWSGDTFCDQDWPYIQRILDDAANLVLDPV